MAGSSRKIATLLALDVADYQRHSAGGDPVFPQILTARLEAAQELVAEHSGRCFGNGDSGLVASFPSASDAVRYGVAVQQFLLTENEPLPLDQRILLRIGLTMGEVSEADGKLIGDAVDIARGLLSLAVPGGICLASSVYEQVQHRVHVGFEFAGEKTLKNVPQPVAIYQVVEPGVVKGYFSLWEELKRRNVFRVGAAYSVVAWLLIQAASIILPTFDAPRWLMQGFVSLTILGFPVALVLAWVYELTPMGLKRSDEVLRQSSIREITGKRFNAATISLLVVALAIVIFDNYVAMDSDDVAPELDSIAVLAFENLSTDPDDEYFADGLADELLGALSRILELRVASRTASFYFKGKDVDISTIAATLEVGYIVSGRVRRIGDRIRVTAALDNPITSDLLWSQSFDRDLADILDIQSEIARSVATAIVPVLSARSKRQFMLRPTENAQAYDYYLRGRDYLRRPSETTTLASAIQLLNLAVELDAQFAHAYAGLCEAYLGSFYFSQSTEFFEQAEVACNRALTLDDSLWEVHVALGTLHRYRGQYDSAVLQLQTAISRQPSAVSPYLELARVYAARNLIDEAEAMFRRAEGVESGYWAVHNEFGNFLWDLNRYEESIPFYERVIQLVPDSGIGHDNLGNAYLALGQWDRAVTVFNASPLPSRWTYTNRGLIHFYLQEFSDAVEDQLQAINIAPDVHASWGRIADAYRYIPGEEENAAAAYRRAIELAERELSINPADWESLGRLITYYIHAGQTDRAAAELEKLFDLTADPTAYYFAALASASLDDFDRVFEYLQIVLDSGWSRATIEVEPDFSILREDERYTALMNALDR
jgi:TolB-like protein/class 3 adenylate cyclase/Tfp pilus assembly protein PilF